MKIEQNYSLKKHNTFGLDVKTRWFMEYYNEEELQRILRDEYFHELTSLHIGEGSNLLFVTDYSGAIVHSGIKGIDIYEECDDAVLLRIGAGEIWDEVVSFAVENNWGGIENLSLIPGESGSAAVQNIGAYGMEIADVIETVEAYNQLTGERKAFSREECMFSYRKSFFKDPHQDPHIITYINVRLPKNPRINLSYKDLELAFKDQTSITPADVRKEVIRIRESKLPDIKQLGNAGSFFMNPIISTEQFAELVATYPDISAHATPDGHMKISAGWLIEQSGFKGRTFDNVGVYEKQALVLVNLGGATGDEIASVAETISEAVYKRFGIKLTPEVKFVYS